MELSLKAEQKQILSQKMIQSAEILQMASAQLEEYLNEQALENPVMELSERAPEEFDNRELEKYQWICAHDEQNRYLYQKMETADDDFPEWNVDAGGPETLKEYLWSQLVSRALDRRKQDALLYILESLDSRGYYTDSLEQVAEKFQLKLAEAEELLGMVQELEPHGVGARDLSECLCLQLKAQGELTEKLETLICGYLPEIAKNQLPGIAKSMKIPLAEVKQMCSLIRGLEPKPGARFSDVRHFSYITPDVIVVKFKEHFDILLNESLYPDISLNREYVTMCAEQTDLEVKKYLMDKIHQVEWVKQCVAQRNVTLLSVVKEILRCQEAFFYGGPEQLMPLRMADVAVQLDIHESTVSRAVRQKYLQCSWGIFPLDYFFAKAAGSTAGRSMDRPAQATTTEVKRELAAVIAVEDKKKPYSDRVLVELLGEKGYVISRRTVAKYREELGIPGTTGRKEF